MTYGHRPVMLDEVAGLIDAGPGAVYVDATVGLGGHAERLAEMAGSQGHVLGLDRDPSALEVATQRLARFGDRVILVRRRFSEVDRAVREAGFTQVQGILFDLGLCSGQVDVPERGFSFHGSGPLDMRMDQTADEPTAADLVNSLSAHELTRVFRDWGEEKWADRIAAFIVRKRKYRKIETTDELVAVIKEAVPAAARRHGPHPARRVFQALRIAVNGEMTELGAALGKVPDLLARTGRVAVLSYHSLEDRLVKTAFRAAERGDWPSMGGPLRVLTPKPVLPGEDETAANPRARSAKLRAAERL